MDRKKNSKAGFVGVFCGTVLLLIAAQSFGDVTNGLFDSSLDGWTSNDPTRVVWSPTDIYGESSSGAALLRQTPDATDITPSDSSILWQSFTVNPDSSSLLFDVRTPVPIISETDHFYIQLLDSANNPLLGNPGNDYFFHWKSGSDADPGVGWIQNETPTGITVNEDPFIIADSYLYSFDIPVAPSWINNNITLQFKLNNDYTDGSDTSILVDNVRLAGSVPVVVPVPAAISLAVLGLAGIRLFRKTLL
jgi:hypothetical protein